MKALVIASHHAIDFQHHCDRTEQCDDSCDWSGTANEKEYWETIDFPLYLRGNGEKQETVSSVC